MEGVRQQAAGSTQTKRQSCRNVYKTGHSPIITRKGTTMSKPEYNFTFTVGANQIATKRYTRKELAQDLRGFRAQPTRYSVCKNENAIVVEMLPIMADRAIAIYVRCYK